MRKPYQVVADEAAAKIGLIRVIDDSGEDYVYPQGCFALLQRAVSARS
jgi:hypothetical protein